MVLYPMTHACPRLADPCIFFNGFVRFEYRGAILPLNWSLHQCPLYPPPPSKNVVTLTNDHNADGKSYNVKTREPLPNKLHRLSQHPDLDNSRRSVSSHRNSFPGSSFSGRKPTQGISLDRRQVPQYASDLVLHQELQWHGTWSPRSLGLHWDVIRPPATTKALSSRYNIVVPDYTSPALHKAVEHLELWSDHPVLACYMRELNWGSIPVGGNPTVLELIQSIYNYLNRPLTQDDLRYVRSTSQNRHLLEQARQRRIEEGYYAINDVERKGPFRRSDVLGSHRCFYGIRATKMGDGQDVLFFNFGPGRIPRY